MPASPTVRSRNSPSAALASTTGLPTDASTRRRSPRRPHRGRHEGSRSRHHERGRGNLRPDGSDDLPGSCDPWRSTLSRAPRRRSRLRSGPQPVEEARHRAAPGGGSPRPSSRSAVQVPAVADHAPVRSAARTTGDRARADRCRGRGRRPASRSPIRERRPPRPVPRRPSSSRTIAPVMPCSDGSPPVPIVVRVAGGSSGSEPVVPSSVPAPPGDRPSQERPRVRVRFEVGASRRPSRRPAPRARVVAGVGDARRPATPARTSGWGRSKPRIAARVGAIWSRPVPSAGSRRVDPVAEEGDRDARCRPDRWRARDGDPRAVVDANAGSVRVGRGHHVRRPPLPVSRLDQPPESGRQRTERNRGARRGLARSQLSPTQNARRATAGRATSASTTSSVVRRRRSARRRGYRLGCRSARRRGRYLASDPDTPRLRVLIACPAPPRDAGAVSSRGSVRATRRRATRTSCGWRAPSPTSSCFARGGAGGLIAERSSRSSRKSRTSSARDCRTWARGTTSRTCRCSGTAPASYPPGRGRTGRSPRRHRSDGRRIAAVRRLPRDRRPAHDRGPRAGRQRDAEARRDHGVGRRRHERAREPIPRVALPEIADPEGHVVHRCHRRIVADATAQIHATIGTGVVPDHHGIIGHHLLVGGQITARGTRGRRS